MHADAGAADSADLINARAYTVGHNIAFGRGQYSPRSGSGRQLLAHELAHVVRQTLPNPTGRTAILRVQRQQDPAPEDPKQRAKKLNAVDARAILQASLPYVLARMSNAQIQQVQRVLDAAVVNQEVSKEVDDLWRKSIKRYGPVVYTQDPALARRAEHAAKGFIPVEEADKRIRLDYKALLAPDALRATTDNPDEARYLKRVEQTLVDKGVWLRLSQPFVRDPKDPSAHIIDPRRFEAWLSLGPDGGPIPTDSGRLTRETLLKNTSIASGYVERVYWGPVQSALDREIKRVSTQIQDGMEKHIILTRQRQETPNWVVGGTKVFSWITDKSPLVTGMKPNVGGHVRASAELPDFSIWDQPHALLLKAMDLNSSGNVRVSQVFLVVAAISARNTAQLLEDYVDNLSAEVERVVNFLEVVKTCGEVAQVGLTVVDVAAAAQFVRGAVVITRGGEATVRLLTAAEVDAGAARLVKEVVAENPEFAGDLAKVRLTSGPRGKVAGAIEKEAAEGTTKLTGRAATRAGEGVPVKLERIKPTVHLGGKEHALSIKRVANELKVWLCSNGCGALIAKAEAMIAKLPARHVARGELESFINQVKREATWIDVVPTEEEAQRVLGELSEKLEQIESRYPGVVDADIHVAPVDAPAATGHASVTEPEGAVAVERPHVDPANLDPPGTQYKKPISGLSGKTGSTDIPSWVKNEGYRDPRLGESGEDYATRLLDHKYGEGNWRRGPGTEFSKIQKWADRHFSNE